MGEKNIPRQGKERKEEGGEGKKGKANRGAGRLGSCQKGRPRDIKDKTGWKKGLQVADLTTPTRALVQGRPLLVPRGHPHMSEQKCPRGALASCIALQKGGNRKKIGGKKKIGKTQDGFYDSTKAKRYPECM